MFIQHLVEENGHQVQKTTTLLELFKQYLLHADTKLEVLCITRWNNYTALGESKTLHTIELTGEFSGHLKECIAKLTAVFEQITPLVNIKTLIISITDPTLFTNDLDLDIPYIKKHAIKELIPGSNNKTIERSYSLTDPLPFKSGDYGFALGQIKFISRPLFNETRCFKCYFHR
ncbi:hypothetical protein DFA_05194 [Cavenderia fasciculata]|uniref:Uncharacterized protein n=1 Tax=Cavenderia fasciculata TaxID=261658 RepID=F4PNL1_CACFS|nr:uncharacterized protein DFA_05194 [Cavenderia fasciculata]EGG23064.1 hypothetical protein DFA_05194 [Cavenderia fasciculata]|eukprot:XP_004360915.1 hypothetical protein DFA_05194 [Cavenderia fasciculata]